MNVNPSSERYGQIVPWDSLSEAEQKSGDWIKLPTHDENGEPAQARKVSMIEKAFGRGNEQEQLQRRAAAQERVRNEMERLEARLKTMEPVAKAWNEGENRYRQTVLGQGPLPGHPIIKRDE